MYNSENHSNTLRKVVIAGGVRIPFCRSNSVYAELSNLDMLADTLQMLSTRFSLAGKKIDEVVAGAVTSHSKDWNLAREALLSTELSPATPGITLQMACGTSLQAALMSAAKIATGQIDCAIAAGTDTTSDAPIVFKRRFAHRLLKVSQARNMKARLAALKGFRLSELAPQAPANGEPRTGLAMGEHCELMAHEWGVTRQEQDQLALESHLKAAAAYDAGFFDDMVQMYEGVARDNNLRADSTLEKLAALKPAFDKKHGTLTAGNSTPLTDGAAAVLLCSEEWAKANDLPIQAYLTAGRSSAIDFVHGEGLLMAPTVAVSELLMHTGLTLQDFDSYEIHEAFAAQALCTLKAWEDPDFCRHKLGRDHAMGAIDRNRMNIKGGSLAFGHPFAATGARVLGNMAAILEERGNGRGLISVCTAGGMGVAAIVERP
ncbi:acetyl-CoA C-acetyltransferase [Pseudohongiella spirulinae]|uniref:Acetyl-CoA acetyltransferase n=1 Tax=Pseudohongiella spirulinae TaxID=1249552 RepID=A0A0S2KFV8_9GAMM|nr:acetyl-CoA C-acetyltransferase [Pseudohongiella spirulinae]ALO47223.1 acetyl-CoA acetyltransferase [Pseudohongiella spirulinae]